MLRILHSWCLVVCFIILFHYTIQKSTPESSTYVAAVVEYSPQLYKLGNHTDNLLKNAEHYVELMRKAADQSADIIVFPECGLAEYKSSTRYSSTIPDPEDNANPCDDPSLEVHEAVRILSCAARKYEIYVVVNIPEKKISYEKSSQNKSTLYYNSNVIFNRQGQIVARYRKFNLFGELGFSTTEKPDITVFDTDFGVKFGVFTCFDIIFEKPAVTLVKDNGVTDVVFPTAWFSQLPFLSAVQTQVAWAHSMDVNFLGSGYNAPEVGSTGSGIYAGKHGVLTSIMATSPTTAILVATVPKKTTQVKNLQSNTPLTINGFTASGSGIRMSKENLEPYKTFLLTENIQNTTHKLCDDQLCCQFKVKMHTSHKNGYKYRLAVFDGVRSFTYRTGGLQICAVIFCTNDSLTSCGIVSGNPDAFSTTFEYISISGDFRLNGVALSPNTLLKEYNVMSPDDFRFESQQQPEANLVSIKMETTARQTSLLTFGIYGRDFLKDGQSEIIEAKETESREGENSAYFIVSSAGIVISAIATVLFIRALL